MLGEFMDLLFQEVIAFTWRVPIWEAITKTDMVDPLVELLGNILSGAVIAIKDAVCIVPWEW